MSTNLPPARQRRRPDTDKPATEKAAGPDAYEIGYGKPPKSTQFKPGQSGNPKGRPKGRKTLASILDGLLFETMQIRENGRVRNVPYIEVALMQMRKEAVKGDRKALEFLIRITSQMAASGKDGEEAETADILDSDADLKILAEYAERLRSSGETVVVEDRP